MSTLEQLTARIREALSVDVTYEAEIIPFAIDRAARRLLRDYHFPWAIAKKVFTGLTVGQQDYTLPLALKKELLVLFYDTVDDSYSRPLLKREGFLLPRTDGEPRYYWLYSSKLVTDVKVPVESTASLELHVWYESADPALNMDWLLSRFEDILFTYTTFRLAAERGKKEVAEIYGPLWMDERQALAVYLNELEFDNMELVQREPDQSNLSRYPIS